MVYYFQTMYQSFKSNSRLFLTRFFFFSLSEQILVSLCWFAIARKNFTTFWWKNCQKQNIWL